MYLKKLTHYGPPKDKVMEGKEEAIASLYFLAHI